jgi:hypothetical protein
VRTALTAQLADSTLKRGRNLVLKGRTTPVKSGYKATLWRHTANGNVVLATAKTKSDGTYRLAYEVNKKGTWKVYATDAKGGGNLSGTSPIRKATVS